MSSQLLRKIFESDYLTMEELCIRRNKIYTFLNPVSYLIAIKNDRLFERFDGILVDGSVLTVAIRLLYGKRIKRRSFDMTSVAASVFQKALSENKTVYLIGARQEQIERSVNILKGKYPQIRIVGYRNGYFSSSNEVRNTYETITRLNPDYVIVGMGAPQQESFLLQLKDYGYNGIGFTCGGFIAQLSVKGIDYYPKWTNKYNLRFLYRFYIEQHTRKRYLKALFLFPIHFIWNRLK